MAGKQIKERIVVISGAAEGDETEGAGFINSYIIPEVTPTLAYRYLTQNIHMRNNLINMRAQIFPGEPTIDVIDINEEVNEEATAWLRPQTYDALMYNSMQISWLECMGYGCSVKSPGYGKENGEYRLLEIRDLPAISFRNPPTEGVKSGVPNGLMPGVIWDTEQKKVRVWQTVGNNLIPTEIENFVVIRDPTTPAPAGLAYCLPCYPVISAINVANHAANQQVARTGTPLIVPQLSDLSKELSDWAEVFVKRWGKNVGFVAPPGVTFADLNIHETQNAKLRLEMLIKWIDGYFNPTTILKREGTAIGATDSAAMQVWNNYIAGQQSWVEYAYEQMLIPVLKANGYEDLYPRVRLQRPQLDKSQIRSEQLKIGILGKALTPQMIYDNLTELDLPEWDDALKEELALAYPAAVNPFAGFGGGAPPGQESVLPEGQPFGQIQNITPLAPKNPVVLRDTERDLITAIRQCKKTVLDEVMHTYPHKG